MVATSISHIRVHNQNMSLQAGRDKFHRFHPNSRYYILHHHPRRPISDIRPVGNPNNQYTNRISNWCPLFCCNHSSKHAPTCIVAPQNIRTVRAQWPGGTNIFLDTLVKTKPQPTPSTLPITGIRRLICWHHSSSPNMASITTSSSSIAPW